MNSYKIQTIEKLLKQRAVLIASKSFADKKIDIYKSDTQPKIPSQNEQKDFEQYYAQSKNCEREIAELDACINWLKVVAS